MPAAPLIKYVLGYRSRTRTLTLKFTKKQNDTGIKLNIELYLSYFLKAGGGLVITWPITGSGSQTRMDGTDF